MEQIINILIGTGAIGFFAFLILKERKDNKSGPKIDYKDPFNSIKDKIKPPDLNKIKEELKDETPQESADNVNDLLNDLFNN